MMPRENSANFQVRSVPPVNGIALKWGKKISKNGYTVYVLASKR